MFIRVSVYVKDELKAGQLDELKQHWYVTLLASVTGFIFECRESPRNSDCVRIEFEPDPLHAKIS